MHISMLETLISPLQPNVTILRLHSSDDLIGLGETFYGATAVEAYLHDVAAPILLNLPAPSPERVARALSSYVGYQGSGVETRGNSAIDIALWDLLGRRAGLPLRDILGGPVTDDIAVYNTCAGPGYIRDQSLQSSANWGLDGSRGDDFEDLEGFLTRPANLAKELLAAGYRGMKVWPFDLAAEASGGTHRADLAPGLDILDSIRSEIGSELEIYVELHSNWTLGGAQRLFRELAKFDLTWAEDPLRPDHTAALTRLAGDTAVPIATGESLAGQRAYQPLFEAGAIDIAIVDLGWTGGLSEARRIANLAHLYGIPVAPHDCTGPISLAAALHWVTSVPNGFVQETSRAFYHGWYAEFVEQLPPLVDGRMRPTDGPGLGITLRAELLTDRTTRIRRTTR